jgi:hypothetical protein
MAPPYGNLPPDTPIPGQLAGLLLRKLAHRLAGELEECHLRLIGGDTVQIVCVAEVEDWLQGWAARVEAGERP